MIEKDLITKNWLKIKEQILQTKIDNSNLKIIPVTKSVGIEEINILISLGFTNFAENRIDQLKDKIKLVNQPHIKWDFIGNIQSRKIPEIISVSHLIHSVGNHEIITKIDEYGQKNQKTIDILLQINVAEEPQKSGFAVPEIKQIFSKYLNLKNIRIKGLMTMAPQTSDATIIRKTFLELRKLKELIKQDAYSDFNELSMGMSNDFMIALQEGATIVRIGSSFFKENDT